MAHTATLRPTAPTWRLGQDAKRHAVDKTTIPPRGACGIRLRDERYDNPTAARCLGCLEKLLRASL